MYAELTYLLFGIQLKVCTCSGQVSALVESHLFLLGSLVYELYTFTAADYKTYMTESLFVLGIQ